MISRKLALVLFAALLSIGIAGCEQETDAEQIGETIDETIEDAGNAVEDACEEVKEGADVADTDC